MPRSRFARTPNTKAPSVFSPLSHRLPTVLYPSVANVVTAVLQTGGPRPIDGAVWASVDKCCPRRPAHDGEPLERWAPSIFRSQGVPLHSRPVARSARVSISSCPAWWLRRPSARSRRSWVYYLRACPPYITLPCKTSNKRSAHHRPTIFPPRRARCNPSARLTYLQPLVPGILLCAELRRPGGTTSRPGARPAQQYDWSVPGRLSPPRPAQPPKGTSE